jgi:hypothetical protein
MIRFDRDVGGVKHVEQVCVMPGWVRFECKGVGARELMKIRVYDA